MPGIRGEFRARFASAGAPVWESRKPCANSQTGAGTRNAPGHDVSNKIEAWTIPFHIIMWTTLLCGLIMVMVVIMLHR
jgi:hypothetical protein